MSGLQAQVALKCGVSRYECMCVKMLITVKVMELVGARPAGAGGSEMRCEQVCVCVCLYVCVCFITVKVMELVGARPAGAGGA